MYKIKYIFFSFFFTFQIISFNALADRRVSNLPTIELLEKVTIEQSEMIERNFKNGKINEKERKLVISNLDSIILRLQKVKTKSSLDALEIKNIRSQLTQNYKLTSRLAKNSDLYIARLSS